MPESRVSPNKNAPYVVGVDVGDTDVRAAVVDKNEKLVCRVENLSDANSGVARTVARIAEAVRGATSKAGLPLDEIGAVGMEVPGHIDVPTGVIG